MSHLSAVAMLSALSCTTLAVVTETLTILHFNLVAVWLEYLLELNISSLW